MTKKSFWNNGWTIGIGTGVIVTGIIKLFETFTEYKIFHTLWDCIVWFFKLFVVKFEIPFYGLIIIFLSGILLLILFAQFLAYVEKKKNNSKQTNRPKFYDYKSDTFRNVKYIWEYQLENDKQSKIIRIQAMCPKCNCLLVEESCPNCSKSYIFDILYNAQVEALIIHRLENRLTPYS